jgi:heme exporter protein D
VNTSTWLSVALVLALCAAAWYIRVLRHRRNLEREIQQHRDREAQRARYCDAFGHHLDELCTCTRCLSAQHDYEPTGTERSPLRHELVNPDADPGALYLDSNFQPDYDYGLYQTVYLVVKMYRCRRCFSEMETREEVEVPDER